MGTLAISEAIESELCLTTNISCSSVMHREAGMRVVGLCVFILFNFFVIVVCCWCTVSDFQWTLLYKHCRLQICIFRVFVCFWAMNLHFRVRNGAWCSWGQRANSAACQIVFIVFAWNAESPIVLDVVEMINPKIFSRCGNNLGSCPRSLFWDYDSPQTQHGFCFLFRCLMSNQLALSSVMN